MGKPEGAVALSRLIQITGINDLVTREIDHHHAIAGLCFIRAKLQRVLSGTDGKQLLNTRKGKFPFAFPGQQIGMGDVAGL